MPNRSPGFASRPDYRVDLVPETRRVKVVFGGLTIADSGAALRVEETSHGPVHYLPEKDVRLDLMQPTEHHTRCPYKGQASYWTIELPNASGPTQRAENAVWAYPTPYDEVSGLAGYYAFYPNRVDAITVT
jgi:adenylate cyclase